MSLSLFIQQEEVRVWHTGFVRKWVNIYDSMCDEHGESLHRLIPLEVLNSGGEFFDGALEVARAVFEYAQERPSLLEYLEEFNETTVYVNDTYYNTLKQLRKEIAEHKG